MLTKFKQEKKVKERNHMGKGGMLEGWIILKWTSKKVRWHWTLLAHDRENCWVLVNTLMNQTDSDQCHTHIHQIIIYAATRSNQPHHCILTHFNNCNFSKAQTVCSLMMVFRTETCGNFLMSILMQI
jgi:hypothetical protein